MTYHKTGEQCSPSLLLDCIQEDYGITKFRFRYETLAQLASILVKSGVDVHAKVQKGKFAGHNYQELVERLLTCVEQSDEPQALRNTLEAIKKADAEVVAYKSKRRELVEDPLCEDVAFLIEEYENPQYMMTEQEYEQLDKALMASEKPSIIPGWIECPQETQFLHF